MCSIFILPVYVNIDAASAVKSKIKFRLMGKTDFRKWNINVTQILCNSTEKGKYKTIANNSVFVIFVIGITVLNLS